MIYGNELDKNLIAAKASLNASCLDSDGNTIKLSECAIHTNGIVSLSKYLNEKNENNSKKFDNKKLEKRCVIPVTLPNGEMVKVEVNSNGQDEIIIRDDKNEITPRMRALIEENIPEGLKDIVGEESFNKEFFPDTLEEFAERVSDDELIPEDGKEAAKRLGIKTEREIEEEIKADELKEIEEQEKDEEEHEELDEEKNEELEEEKDEEEQEKLDEEEQEELDEDEGINEIPEEVRDEISKICSENDLDINNIKQVLKVGNPKSITDKVEDTGIDENGGTVTSLRFRDASLTDKVINVQDGRVLENRNNRDMTRLMDDKTENEVENLSDNESKIVYTDLDGNTTVCDLTKEPRDLTMEKKDELKKELDKIDSQTELVKNDSEMSVEDKAQMFQKINEKRLTTLKNYGISVPKVENEIQADIEITEEIQEKEDTAVEDEDSEPYTKYAEGRIPKYLQDN